MMGSASVSPVDVNESKEAWLQSTGVPVDSKKVVMSSGRWVAR